MISFLIWLNEYLGMYLSKFKVYRKCNKKVKNLLSTVDRVC